MFPTCFLISAATLTSAIAEPLSGAAQHLFQQAKETGRFFADAQKAHPEVWPTSDGKSFLLVWRAATAPKRWIVSLHGAGHPAKGFATDELAVWLPHLKDRNVGIVCIQWWMGTGDGIRDFYTPQENYREIDLALQRLKVEPGKAMLHGFSRGAANSYAVMAVDASRGKHYFCLAVASSGAFAHDYPPNRALLAGEYGDHPLKGTRWITCAGARDPSPERDGIEGMRTTAATLKEQGATVVESIEDPKFGHGALMLNPGNIKHVLDLFLNPK